MDRSPPRGPRGGGGGGGGGRRGGGGGRDNERYGGRATDPYHSSRKRSRSRSPETRNHRDHYRERDGRGDREYPKHDGRGPDREHRGSGPSRRGGRGHDAPPERERPALPDRGDRDREYTGPSARSGDRGGRGGGGRDDHDKSRRHRSRSRDRHTAADRRQGRTRSRERDGRRADGARSRSGGRHIKERPRRGADIDILTGNPRSEGRRTVSPSNNKSAAQSPPIAQDTEMAGTETDEVAVEDSMEGQMQAMMGFGGFGTTKQKKVKGNDVGAISKNTTTKYRQYMNRPGGFNRALSPS